MSSAGSERGAAASRPVAAVSRDAVLGSGLPGAPTTDELSIASARPGRLRRAARLLTTRDDPARSAGDQRLRRAGLSALGMAANKGLQVVVTIVSVPWLLEHLGVGDFGLLMAISGFTLWFQADLGLADGVKVRLIECLARGDRQAARAFVSTGLAALCVTTLVLAAVFACVWPLADWATWFRAEASSAAAVSAAVAVGLLLTLVVIPLKLLREVTSADQRGYVYSFWAAGGTLLSLGGIALALHLGAGLPGVLLAMQGAGVLALLAGSLYLFGRDRPWLRPRAALVDRATWSRLWPDSAHLLLLGVSLMAINGTDAFLVNAVSGNAAAAEYTLAVRLPYYVQVVVGFVTFPAWPAIGDAVQRGERAWAERASRRLVLLNVGVGTLLLGGYAAFGADLVELWSDGRIRPSATLVALLALYVMARVVAAVYQTLLRAHGVVRSQARVTAVEALLHVVLGVLGARTFGLEGMAAGVLLSVVLTRLWAAPLEYARVRASWLAEEPQ